MALAVLLWVIACNAPKTDGGGGHQSIDPRTGTVAQEIEAPDNPASESRSELRDVETTTTAPDGTVTTTKQRESVISIGTAQDLAGILESEGAVEYLRGILLAIVLVIVAVWQLRKGHHLLGAIAGAGAFASIVYGVSYGYAACGISAIAYLAYAKGGGLINPLASIK